MKYILQTPELSDMIVDLMNKVDKWRLSVDIKLNREDIGNPMVFFGEISHIFDNLKDIVEYQDYVKFILFTKAHQIDLGIK